ncbi:MAG: tyrosine-type recombinase/integrase [Rhodopseudomonas sp.]|uniref:tyrosine-type recombinase/integrase n=1 Tax=Rhodopseudomonas sp. TaxID=1078 RepID=UPI0017CA6046|nr:site-specific integrase [Rhodopseudomonas sp.]NVN88605.1 tyrosine-type recombinase/integrase [Rhodopseudomonas sp.]
MARTLNNLSAKFVETTEVPGRYSDGGGLYLQVTAAKNGGVTKSWLFRYMRGGTTSREMGLGPVSMNKRDGGVTTREARDRAYCARESLKAGIDPLDAKVAARTAQRLEKAKTITFRESVEQFIRDNEAEWKNPKHRDQWQNTLTTYAYPVIGSLSVVDIDTALVLKVLRPIWKEKTETAKRVRGRIESVLNWAKAHHYRDGENPARWKGHLENVLANPSKVAKVKHHWALPYKELPGLMGELRANKAVSARALEWTILSATRTGETIGALWSEIDVVEKVWNVPAVRMKGGVDHRVPLSDRMIQILENLPREGEIVFPGAKAKKPLSNMAMLELVRGMKGMGATVHGFRSTFRDWAAETTGYANEVVEMALAHAVKDKTEAAYRRGDLFDKRVRLMADWENYCSGPADTSCGQNVVAMRYRV